jgi:hypothetical protein
MAYRSIGIRPPQIVTYETARLTVEGSRPRRAGPSDAGWSADTAERGLATLEHVGLLTRTTRLKKAPLSPTGLTKVNRYLLHEPFSRPTLDDIFNDDVIDAIVYPLPPKKRPGKDTVGETEKKTAP